MRNWIMLKPFVKIVVFTNSVEDTQYLISMGVLVQPVSHLRAGEAPILRWMFEEIDKIAQTPLRGYINSDILFTDDLIHALDLIMNAMNMAQPFMAVGRRTNILAVTETEAQSFAKIKLAAKARGELFWTNAEDFFITNAAYPWKNIMDVVIGRPVYDNWIVAHSICDLQIDVIDVSGTILAVHQSTTSGGNKEGFKHEQAKYNLKMFDDMDINGVDFDRGKTDCTQWRTILDFCGQLKLVQRVDFPDHCVCVKKYS
ncbi:hypothetical protein DPMN_027860 [Dreissena polymorpha]|uniref:Uncharacterized protein n=1 Tax=Dreissena polymorpha TaxID=45954 RepID=A0A9D4LVK5_DREPO|nr:hypothetical protein DPMN_027860 [Dreissena polymorpha]